MKAQQMFKESRDYSEVLRLLRAAENKLFPGTAQSRQTECLLALAAVSLELGHLREARQYYQRIAELSTDPLTVASSLVNEPLVLYREYRTEPSQHLRDQALDSLRRNLPVIEAVDDWELKVLNQSQLGQMLGLPAGRSHFELCRDIAIEHGSVSRGSQCLAAWAATLAQTRPENPQDALTLLDTARNLTQQSDDVDAHTRAYVEAFAIQVYWLVLDPEEALDRSETSLRVLEAFRQQQTSEKTRARLFDLWSLEYQVLVGRLLEAYSKTGRRLFLERAFQISERLRARVLLESLVAPAIEIPAALIQERDDILSRLTKLQRDVLMISRSNVDPQAAASQIEELEMELDRVQFQILRHRYPERGLVDPDFASAKEVQALLRPDEALLAFQLAPAEDLYGRFAGGSWIFVITPTTFEAHRIPEGDLLLRNLPVFLGFFEARDGREGRMAAKLHEILLEAGLQSLTPKTRQLILLPDAKLHSVPLSALRSPLDQPLAERFALTRIPSATLWVDWRNRPPSAGSRPALVLADPLLTSSGSPTTETTPATRSAEGNSPVLIRSSNLGPIPLAREEGRALRRRLGSDTVLRTGAAASESFLKTQDLSTFEVLHFAAHARANVRQPDRSSVYLAPGTDPMTDGLLQFREIVDLDLDGRIVVLSACDTATGEILRGEGVLDLARAFFQGGAHAVVASLWPLRDDDGRDFFDAFYRHLAEGESLAGALQGAQIDRIEAGAPAAAWAGIVVLGDGSMVPFPNAKARLSFVTVVLLAFGLFLVAAVIASLLAKGRAP